MGRDRCGRRSAVSVGSRLASRRPSHRIIMARPAEGGQAIGGRDQDAVAEHRDHLVGVQRDAEGEVAPPPLARPGPGPTPRRRAWRRGRPRTRSQRASAARAASVMPDTVRAARRETSSPAQTASSRQKRPRSPAQTSRMSPALRRRPADDRRGVDESAHRDPARARQGEEGPGAVRRREDDRAAPDAVRACTRPGSCRGRSPAAARPRARRRPGRDPGLARAGRAPGPRRAWRPVRRPAPRRRAPRRWSWRPARRRCTTAVTPASGIPRTSSSVSATSITDEPAGLILVAQGADAEPERVQADEALGVLLTVHRVGLERHHVLAVEASGATGAPPP